MNVAPEALAGWPDDLSLSKLFGWLLSPAELSLLWHAPTNTVRTPQLRTNESREFEPPPRDQLPTIGRHPDLAVIGRVAFRERRETFGMLSEDRFRHLYVVGQTGTGKSTLLLNLAAADVAAGRSVVLLDPHGDLCEQLGAQFVVGQVFYHGVFRILWLPGAPGGLDAT